MSTNRYSIHGNYIQCGEGNSFQSGFIFIKGEKFQRILADLEQNANILKKKLQKYPLKFDFKNLFIMPGCIDLNTNLNLLHSDQQFIKTQFFTSLYSMGGVTSIINSPSSQIGSSYEKFRESDIVELQLKILEQNSFLDFGQLALLNESTMPDLKTIKRSGAIAFQMHMSPQPQNVQKPYYKDYQQIKNTFQFIKDQKDPYTVFIHTQSMQEKDLMVTSPFRRLKLEFRCLEDYSLKNEATDGLKGNIDSDEEDDISEIEREELEKKLLSNTIDFNSFFRLARDYTKKTQYELLSRAEELQYMKKGDQERNKFEQQFSKLSNEKLTLESKRQLDFSDLLNHKSQKSLYFEQFYQTQQLKL